MRLHLAIACIAAMPASACSKTMEDAECQEVANHMRDVWKTEAERAAPPVASGAPPDKLIERANGVIRTEGERVIAEWTTECQRELVGRPVDRDELDCVMSATTIAQIKECATKKK